MSREALTKTWLIGILVTVVGFFLVILANKVFAQGAVDAEQDIRSNTTKVRVDNIQSTLNEVRDDIKSLLRKVK